MSIRKKIIKNLQIHRKEYVAVSLLLVYFILIATAGIIKKIKNISATNYQYSDAPDDDIIYNNIGSYYNSLGSRYPQAEEMFKKALRVNPNSFDAHNNLGHCYLNQLRYPEAEKMFKQAMRVDPRRDESYDGLGRVYSAQLRYSEAEEMFKKIK